MRPKGLPQTHRALADLADRQYGVVSIRQLTGPLGYSRRSVSRAEAAGRLHRLHRGVFAVGHTRIPLHGKCLAAVLACGPGALLSHRSAAWLWGLAKGSPAPFEVTTPIPRKARKPIRIHHSRILTANDRALREGVPATALPRTLLDCAASEDFWLLQRMLERSEELRLFDLGPVEELLERCGRHVGRGPLRRAIALYKPPAFTRSQFERRFLEAVIARGLPRPAVNINVAGFELDLYWPELRFAVELDSYATHGSHGAFERDRLRQEELLLAGIGMTRVTDVRFEREPDAVLERVARFLAGRRV